MYDTVERIKSWIKNDDGWYYCPDEDRSIKISDDVKIGNRVTIGDGTTIDASVIIDDMVTIGKCVSIHKGVKIGYCTKINDLIKIYDNANISNGVTIDNWVEIGANTNIGAKTIINKDIYIGARVNIGHDVIINNSVTIGDNVEIGNNVIIGEHVTIRNGAKIGNNIILNAGFSLGAGITTLDLAQYFRDLWKLRGETVIFTKWVTKERMSPNFDDGMPIHYPIGKVIEMDGCKADDQQCGAGLHVLEYGHRPEWYGLCGVDHKYMPIDVEVSTDDILFGGLPSMTGKYRVRKLKVLN